MKKVIKAKQLIWKKVKPEVFEDWAEKAEVSVLMLNKEPAYYQVNSVNNEIGAQFWVGNSAFSVAGHTNRYVKIQEAKDDCQRHFNSLIKSNS